METAASLNAGSGTKSKIDSSAWIGTATILGLAGMIYGLILADLAVEWWTVDASSYGMLVPVITFYIIYLRRNMLLSIPACADSRGLWLTGVACLVLLGGKLSAEFFLARISFVVLLAGIAWTFWG